MRDDPDDRREGDPRDGRDSEEPRGDPRRGGTPTRDPEELDERIADLEARVRDLRDELARPPEGPLGLPRPPTPREVLSFTGEYAIPTAIAMLEANVRALEALQQVIRVLDPERSVVREELRDRGNLESRAADASRATLDRLESALEDVESTIRESDLPREDEARDVLEDARRINREIRDRVERERRSVEESRQRERDVNRERSREDGKVGPESDRDSNTDLDGGTTIPLTDEADEENDERSDRTEADDSAGADGDESADGGVEVDVEAELRSIKDEIERPKDESQHDDAADAPASEDASTPTSADAGENADANTDESASADADASTDESPGDETAADESDAENADAKEAATENENGTEELNGDAEELDNNTEESNDDRDERDE